MGPAKTGSASAKFKPRLLRVACCFGSCQMNHIIAIIHIRACMSKLYWVSIAFLVLGHNSGLHTAHRDRVFSRLHDAFFAKWKNLLHQMPRIAIFDFM